MPATRPLSHPLSDDKFCVRVRFAEAISAPWYPQVGTRVIHDKRADDTAPAGPSGDFLLHCPRLCGQTNMEPSAGRRCCQGAPDCHRLPVAQGHFFLCFDSGLPGDMFEADGHTFKKNHTMDMSGPELSNLKAVTMSPAALAKAIQDVQAANLQ